MAAPAKSLSLQEIHHQVLAIASKHHPPLEALIRKNGVVGHREASDNLLTFLARVLVGQMISTKAAASIWSRVSDLSDKAGSLPALLLEENREKLAACGVSKTKTKALILLNQACANQQISDESVRNSNYEQIHQQIKGLYGFGGWSADMLALSFVQLPDVWPSGDGALLNAMRLLFPKKDPAKVASRYKPHRSYLARQIYQAINSGTL